MQKRGRRMTAIVYACAAIAWLCVMFFFSGQSGVDSGALSERVTRWLFGWMIDRGADFDTLHWLTRKAAHASIFAVEGWLLVSALACAMRARWAAVLSAVGCALIAVLNELHQTTSVGRSCNVRDMGIDTCGAAAGIVLALAFWHAWNKLQCRKAKKYTE